MFDDQMETEQPEDMEQTLADIKALLAKDDWEEKYREPLSRSYSPEEPKQESGPMVYGDVEVPKKSAENNAVLIAIIIVETLLLLGVAGWWLLCR